MTFEFEPSRPVRPAAAAEVEAVRPATRPEVDPASTFPQSVASGGPTPTGVVLWTRVDPDAHEPGEPLFVEVAADESFADVRYEGVVDADVVTPAHDYTAKVDLDGELEADSRYYYRFTYDGVSSRTGRCRTLPAPGSSPDRVRFGVLTCQHYQNGYFGAYHHVAGEDVDFLVHLGDFIYETAGEQYRGLGRDAYPDRRIDLPSGHDVVWGLDDFRHLYRTYLSDRFLRAALERHTLIRCWDDHAIANNRYWDYGADAPRAPSHPRGDDPEFVRQLTADGIQAWWEFTPARVDYDPDADHLHDAFRLWRRFEFGDLVTLLATDERLFRTKPLCEQHSLLQWLPFCSASVDPERTMLGAEQREWFLDEVSDSRSVWTVWGNEVLTLPLHVGAGPLSVYPKQDAWDGYGAERERIMYEVAYGDVRNFVTLTGDMHSYLAGYQRLEYPDPIRQLFVDPRTDRSRRVGVELMTPAITSVNVAEAVGVDEGWLGEVTEPLLSAAVRALVPHVEFFDSHRWGYSIVEFTRDACTYRAYSVDKSVDAPDAERSLLTTLRVPEGRVEIETVE